MVIEAVKLPENSLSDKRNPPCRKWHGIYAAYYQKIKED